MVAAMPSRACAERGFTIFEVVAALLVVAAVATVAGVAVGPARDGALILEETRSVAAWLETVRGRSIRRGAPAIVSVDPTAGVLRARGAVVDARVLNVGAQIINGSGPASGQIVFHPDGSTSGGSVRLEIRDRISEIEIEALTGRQRLRDGLSGS